MRHHLFEATDGLFVQTEKRVTAGHIVEHHGIVGVNRKSWRAHSRARSRWPVWKSPAAPRYNARGIIRMQLEMPLDDAQSALPHGFAFEFPTQTEKRLAE